MPTITLNMNILFVCTANVFRSRLAKAFAEEYCKDNNIKNMSFDSCGIIMHHNTKEGCNWKKSLIKNNRVVISNYALNAARELEKRLVSEFPKQITKKLIENNDKIICMKPLHKKYIESNFGRTGKIIVWNIDDLNGSEKKSEEIRKTDEIFSSIKENVTKLINKNRTKS